MTAWLAAAAIAVQSGPIFAALPPTPGDRLAAVAVVRVPEPMSGRTRAAWRVLGEALIEGTQDHARETLLTYGAQSGRRPRVVIGDGWIRIELEAPAEGGMAVAAPILEAMATRPSLDAEGLAEARRRAARPPATAWGFGGDPWRLDIGAVRDDEVRELHRWAFRPDWTTLAVGGAYTSANVARLRAQFAAWEAAPGPRPRPAADADRRTSTGSPVGLATFDGLPVGSQSPELPVLVVAAAALGVGKGSLLHRTLRDADGLTYRQEAFVSPDAGAWRLRVRVAGTALPPTEELRQRFRAAVAALDESDRVRAVAIARASLTRGLPVGPVWLDDDFPYAPSPTGDAAWAAMFGALGAVPPRPTVWAEALDSVTLEAVRAVLDRHLEAAWPQRMSPGGV